jgi:hypothetical protein
LIVKDTERIIPMRYLAKSLFLHRWSLNVRERLNLSEGAMTTNTKQQFEVRLGQMWKEQDPKLGLRICVVDKIQCGQVLLRTVFDEGLIGCCVTSVPLKSLMDEQAHWQFVSEPHQFA